MDKVHKIDEKPWISKRRLAIEECIRSRNNQMRNTNISLDSVSADGIHEPEFESLSRKLEAFVQKSCQDVKPYFFFNTTEEKYLTNEPSCDLKSYRLQLEHSKRIISERAYKIKYLTSLKSTRKEMLMRYLATVDQTKKSDVISMNRDCLMNNNRILDAMIVVQIWHQPSKNEKVRLEKEVSYRSDQFLVELRDQFKCHRDYGVPLDLSNDPDQQTERIYHGQLFKSAFFLIEDTFYNDLRDANNTDLSANIINWAEEKVCIVGEDDRTKRVSRGIGPFNRRKMEESKFEDLSIRLGCPYLYYHQGNCEHLFTISDIRYVSLTRLEQIDFPLISASSVGRKEHYLKCYMCRLRPPHWYTRSNDRLPLDPFFFCENCFRSFNYDKNKKKIGKFEAYLYTNALGLPDSTIAGSSV